MGQIPSHMGHSIGNGTNSGGNSQYSKFVAKLNGYFNSTIFKLDVVESYPPYNMLEIRCVMLFTSPLMTLRMPISEDIHYGIMKGNDVALRYLVEEIRAALMRHIFPEPSDQSKIHKLTKHSTSFKFNISKINMVKTVVPKLEH